MFVGIRLPELEAETKDRVQILVRDLAASNAAAELYELPPMHLDQEQERDRMMHFVRAQVPTATEANGDRLLQLIDRFPGVLERWLSGTHRETMESMEDLERVAADAQRFRYREFDKLLPGLPPDQRRLAMRICDLPQMDESAWWAYEGMLVSGLEPGLVDELSIAGVLETTVPAPSFGHDTRHQAARVWFAERPQFQGALKGETESLIYEASARFHGIDEPSLPFGIALRAIGEAAGLPLVSQGPKALLAAARYLFQDVASDMPGSLDSGIRPALAARPESVALIARALYNRGVSKGQSGDAPGEIADYTAVLELPNAPVEQQAQALLGSGVARIQDGERDNACDQLREALALSRQGSVAGLAEVIQHLLDEMCSKREESLDD